MVLFLVDPIRQINKGKDAQRREDFKQVRNALDTYYNDHSCYPTNVPFGQEWMEGTTLYMKNVPQDPNCDGNSGCYTYVYDENSSCPQWNVLFGKLAIAPPANASACLLQSDCLPVNYSALGYNMCDFGGDIDCSVVSTVTLATPVTSSPTPSPSSTPPVTPGEGVFYCACGNNHVTVCNVTFNPPINVQLYYDSACSNQCGSPC